MLMFSIDLFKVLEHVSICLTRITESFASSSEKLDQFCKHGLVAQAASLIAVIRSVGQASLSTLTYTLCFYFTLYCYCIIYANLLTLAHISLKGVIRVLSICADGSPLAAKILHGISGTLKVILEGSGLVAGTTIYPTSPADQVIIAL
jgi:E3 ubiquitin-protein ligase TRIP12